MKAAGFNTTSIYFSWGYHSPREGDYDFTGIRDMDRVLDEAAKAGIYVIARPGPYINAEVDSGGFPCG
jgi:beta-galactosidase GanA